jgi:hypothetical protein
MLHCSPSPNSTNCDYMGPLVIYVSWVWSVDEDSIATGGLWHYSCNMSLVGLCKKWEPYEPQFKHETARAWLVASSRPWFYCSLAICTAVTTFRCVCIVLHGIYLQLFESCHSLVLVVDWQFKIWGSLTPPGQYYRAKFHGLHVHSWPCQ